MSKDKKDRLTYFLIKTFWPNKLYPDKRNKALNRLFKISVRDRIEDSNNKKYIEPWAFIRVCNEIATLKTSLNSLLPAFKKGVIGYNPCSDGSEEVIIQFCKENPGFIPLKYDHEILPLQTGEKYKDYPYERTLAAYYNKVLSIIPKNEWLMKIDVDHFYFQNVLKHSFSLPKSPDDIVIYSRLDLVRRGHDIRVTNYRRPGDQWLICNKDLKFNNCLFKDRGVYVEQLSMPSKKAKYKPECSNFHFPYEKGRRKFDENEFQKLEKLEDFLKRAPKDEFSEEILDINKVYSILDEFDQNKLNTSK